MWRGEPPRRFAPKGAAINYVSFNRSGGVRGVLPLFTRRTREKGKELSGEEGLSKGGLRMVT